MLLRRVHKRFLEGGLQWVSKEKGLPEGLSEGILRISAFRKGLFEGRNMPFRRVRCPRCVP